jgi:HEAT repeat protein
VPDPDETPLPDRQLLALASDAPGVWEEAAAAILALGTASLPLLERGLEDPRLGSVAHWRILLLLRQLGRAESVPAIRRALGRALEERDSSVTFGAMEALGAFHAPEAVGELVALLAHPDPDIVRRAAVLAGETRSPGALAPLVRLLDGGEPSIRYAATHGLIGLGSPEARAVLARHLARETDDEVRALIRSAGAAGGDGGDGGA